MNNQEVLALQVAALDFETLGGRWANTEAANTAHETLATLVDNSTDFNEALLYVSEIVKDFNY
jgi:hypothetical protein